jgi:threonine dehydrogenase-like Zn-dependent dehydrogenase
MPSKFTEESSVWKGLYPCTIVRYCRTRYTEPYKARPRIKLVAHENPGFLVGPPPARIPFANVGLVKLPDEVSDDQTILLSDIFPTAYFGAELAEIKKGDTVAIFGCGPVGQFTITSAKLLGAGRVFGIDEVPDRLGMARAQGAEVIDFSQEDPVIGVYPLSAQRFPIGEAMNKNLTIKMGNCHHRRYIPRLVALVATGAVDPVRILTKGDLPICGTRRVCENAGEKRSI